MRTLSAVFWSLLLVTLLALTITNSDEENKALADTIVWVSTGAVITDKFLKSLGLFKP